MANYDLTKGVDGLYQNHELAQQVFSKTVDFSKFANGVSYGAQTEYADVITIPAGFVVEDVYYKVITASTTSSSTFSVGDSADPVYYFAATTPATDVAGTIGKTTAYSGKFHDLTSVTTLGQTLTKVYSSADALRVKLGTTAPVNGVVKFYVRGFMLF